MYVILYDAPDVSKAFVRRLRKRSLAALREEVTVSDVSGIEGEIRAIRDALIAAGGLLKREKTVSKTWE